jgi:hypothetical protein
MGHRGDRRRLPPLPWTWQDERDGYVIIYDADGHKVGALWGDAGRCYAAAKFIEWLTVRYGERLRQEFEADTFMPDADKASRDEAARVRGIRMRKERLRGDA